MSLLDEPLAQLQDALDTGGLQAALRYLNRRTPYRYSGIYRLDGQVMHKVALYDRQGEYPEFLSAVPLGDSFCQFVRRDQPFQTHDSAHDGRLAGHPYQGILNAYFGMALSRKPGTLYGTFCHFDTAPMALDEREIALLEAASGLLLQHLD